MRVFISYRRDDSMVTAALLYRELASRPDFADAFMDIDDIGYGDDFVRAIDSALADADVVLVVIGPKWAEMLQARLRGDDWVRHEVQQALRLRDAARPGKAPLRVLPVLIGGAAPPAESALPPALAGLARLGMLKFDEHALRASINSLLEAIQEEDFEGKARRLGEERRKLEQERLLLQGEGRRRTRARLAIVAATFALFVAAMLTVFDLLGLGARAASWTMLLAHVAAPASAWSEEVVLVGIDEATERAVGRRFDASWRAEHAVVIARAASAAARTVAFDIVLEDPGKDEANQALLAALQANAAGEPRKRMPVVFGIQTRASDGKGAMLAPFAPLVRQGIACAAIAIGQARAMPLAAARTGPAASASSGSSASGAERPAAARGPTGADESILPAFALAAYSGSDLVESIDKHDRSVRVRLRSQRRTQDVVYFDNPAPLDGPQPGCDVLQPGDRVFLQLLDPYRLPPLRAAPQRIAYEQILAGDPAALALLRERIVVVGTQLAGTDRMPMPWPADDRWGVELFAAQIDAMTRGAAIVPVRPFTEWVLINVAALLGALCAHRLRERRRALRAAALAGVALVWIAASVAWYELRAQLTGVPYELAALALGAWLVNRNWRRTST